MQELSQSVGHRDTIFQLWSQNDLNLEGGNVERLFETFSSLIVMVLPDLVTETVVKVRRPYASNEVVLVVFRSKDVLGRVIPSLDDFVKLKNIIQNVFVDEKSILVSLQRDFVDIFT